MQIRRYSDHRKLRWFGLTFSVLFVFAFALATFGSVTIHRGGYVAGLFRGCVSAKSAKPRKGGTNDRVRILRHQPGAPIIITWWPSFAYPGQGRWKITIPLWIPVFLLAVPTVILWRRDRRYAPGRCQSCGYDLTGNESGRCPECGTEVRSQ